MLAGGALIFAGVMAAALYALLQRRRGHAISERAMLIGGGLAFPTVTLLVLLVFALVQGERILQGGGPAALRVGVEGSRWAWAFTYPDAPDRPLRTIGELHVAAGQPVEVHVTSRDVIHSFWVPRLGGKIDAIPGKVNILRLQADAPGVYHGVCAEYCGIGHAHMNIAVHAHPRAEFEARLGGAANIPVERAR